ncbi:hypothetical protein GCM10010149_63300 [Nonomuraea roseoviolacea subsp. roseoviolacea]|uniref:Tetrapyrrole biosynthesis glutamyl-tRNA reductase dimerisation domain-containing protein n=1 Tax=Nonomuraea roseoviolacea subsp. carminata TaxID=160689 RepID=A0ABT1K9Y4_9ACTN|nr:hypothetical protein [Nonomuraea roseoviolacea]MCP2349774.1 hypothetical protein [Nonomuraea roseoviolacea subsp. carminata]
MTTAGLAPSPVLPDRRPRRGIGGAIPARRAAVPRRPWITTVPAPSSVPPPTAAEPATCSVAVESATCSVAVALRTKASAVADAELGRLASRAPELDPSAREEVRDAVQRVVDAFLEGPLTSLTRHSGSPLGERYADALRTLFGLDAGRTA